MRLTAKMLPPLSRRLNDRFWLAATRAQLASAPAISALVVADPADRERMLAGAPAFARALDDVVADARGHALMTFRLGYALERALPSPRRPVSAVLLQRAVRRILVV